MADLPGCLHLRCKSRHSAINSVHHKESFQQSRACQEQGSVDRVAVPALPALGMPQLQPLFTEEHGSSSMCHSFPETWNLWEIRESSSILLDLPTQPGGERVPAASEILRVWSFPQFLHLQLSSGSMQKVEGLVPSWARRVYQRRGKVQGNEGKH